MRRKKKLKKEKRETQIKKEENKQSKTVTLYNSHKQWKREKKPHCKRQIINP